MKSGAVGSRWVLRSSEVIEQQQAHQPAPADDEQLDLRPYWNTLLKRKWVVLAVFVASVAAISLYTLRQPKVYAAAASLVIDNTTPQVLGENVREVVDVGSGSYWYTKDFYETQYRIIKSRMVAQRVVDDLHLDQDRDFLGISKLPAQEQQTALERADAAALLQARINVEPVKDSRIVNIRIEDTTPERAALLANAVARAYQQANIERRVEGTQDATAWLEDQLVDLKKKLSSSELALFNFKKDNDLIHTSFENRQTITSQKLIAVNDTLTRIRTRKAELDARVKTIEEARSTKTLESLMELGVVASSPFIGNLKMEYLKLVQEHAEARERYLPEHPKMRVLEERLATARANVEKEVNAILDANLLDYKEVVTTERNLENILEEVKRESFEHNRREMDYRRLAREEENNERLYDMVLKRMKELDLSALLRTNNIRILDEAKVVKLPVKPKVRNNLLLGSLLGLLGGIGLAFLLEFQDRSVKSHTDLESLGVNFLGVLPSIPGNDPAPKRRDLYIASQPRSAVAECCRSIRTNLLFISPDNPIRTLVVTSGGPQEGKTTTLINMGITFAQSGNRVLLVDTDMRRPRLHKSLGVPNEAGMSSLIVGQGTLDAAVKATDVPGLFVLPSGPIPPNPAELIHTQKFKQLVEEMKAKFDRVIFDSPPIGAVADPLLLANQMDGTLLVTKMLKTDKELAARAVRSLQDASARILGAVLNDVDVDRRQYGYYVGYYYGYGQYKEDEEAA